MGRPTISKFGVNQYVDGSPLIINDGNVLSEIAGNIENRVNVQAFNNNFVMSFFWQKDHETYTFGQEAFMAAIQLPVRFKIKEVQFIGYSRSDVANSQFKMGILNSNANNTVDVFLRVFDGAGERDDFLNESGASVKELSATLDTPEQQVKIGDITGVKNTWAGTSPVTPTPLSIEVGTSQALAIVCRVNSSANAAFEPMIQATVVGTMEHAA